MIALCRRSSMSSPWSGSVAATRVPFIVGSGVAVGVATFLATAVTGMVRGVGVAGRGVSRFAGLSEAGVGVGGAGGAGSGAHAADTRVRTSRDRKRRMRSRGDKDHNVRRGRISEECLRNFCGRGRSRTYDPRYVEAVL